LGVALLGGAGALALDEPTAPVTATAVVSRGRRLATRLVVTAAACLAWWVHVALRSDDLGDAGGWWALAVTGTALVVAGPAAAGLLDAAQEPGGLVAAVLVGTVTGLLLLPLPFGLVAFDVSEAWTPATVRWTAVLGGSVLALAVAARRR
jgi:hypothetical protein